MISISYTINEDRYIPVAGESLTFLFSVAASTETESFARLSSSIS